MIFVVRKVALNFFVNMFHGLFKEGKMNSVVMVAAIARTSFLISTCMLLGNVLLLYQSQDIRYAVLGSCASIVTEVAGKMYMVASTKFKMKRKLSESTKRRVKAVGSKILGVAKGSSKIGAAGKKAGEEGGAEAEGEGVESGVVSTASDLLSTSPPLTPARSLAGRISRTSGMTCSR